jgi:hypothetical protein
MKLPAIIRRDTQGTLMRVQESLEAGEGRLTELGNRRLALLESGDIAGARRVDQEIAAVFGDVAALKDRAVILEGKVAAENRDRAAEQYRQAVDKLEAPIAARSQAAVLVEKAAAQLADAVRQFKARSDVVRNMWSGADLYCGTTRLASLLAGEFAPDTISRLTRKPVTGDEVLARCLRADLGGFAKAEAAAGRELLEDLRHAHDPLPVDDDSESTDEQNGTDESDEAAA